MWDEYARSIGTTANKLTQEQKIQAEVNGILNETRFQTGDAAKVAGTYAGQVAMLSFNFQQLKVAVGNAIMPIAKAVLPVINTIISALTTLANVFAQVTSLLFGKSYEPLASAQKGIASSGAAAADSTQDLADATAGAGSASKKAAKDMKGVLAGFDDLNVLASRTADNIDSAATGVGDLGSAAGGALDLSGVETGGELFGDVTVNPEIAAFIERLKAALEPTIEALGRLWAELQRLGEFAWQGLEGFYNNFLRPVGEWVLGEDGLPRFIHLIADTMENINWERLVSSFNGLWEQLAKMATFAGDALIDFVEYFLKPLSEWTMNEAIPRLVDALTEGLSQVNWEAIRQGLIELWKALEPFAENVGEGLLWLWENVLVPFGTWTMNEVVPRFLGLVATAVDIVNAAIERAKPAFSWFWENWLKPLWKWTGDFFLTFLDRFHGWLELIAGVLTGDFERAVGGAKEIVSSFLERLSLIGDLAKIVVEAIIEWWSGVGEWFHTTVIQPVGELFSGLWDRVSELAGEAWEAVCDAFSAAGTWFYEHVIHPVSTFFTGLWDGIKEAASAAWEGVSSAWNAAGEWFNTNIIQPVQKFFSDLWAGVQKAAQDAWAGISNVWNVVSGWFNANIIQPVAGFFRGLWEGISKAAGDAWKNITDVFGKAADWFRSTIIDPVTNGFKGFFNGLIGFAEGFVNFFIRGINKIVSGINSLSFDLPGILGGGHIGFNIPRVSELRLPRLASGAVIPPNSQFAAILGDQRSGVNIESPLSTIEQALRNVLESTGGPGGDITVDFTINLDSREIYRGQKRVTRQIGKSLVGGLA